MWGSLGEWRVVGGTRQSAGGVFHSQLSLAASSPIDRHPDEHAVAAAALFGGRSIARTLSRGNR